MFGVKKFLVAGLAVSALALAGCAGGAQPASSDAAKKPDVLTLLRTNASGSLQTAAAKSEKAKSFSVVVDGAVAGKPLKGTGKVALGSPVSAEMQMNLGGYQTTVLLIGTVEYIKAPSEKLSEMGGKNWIKLDLAEAAKLAGMNGDQLVDQMRNMDPAKQIKAMLANGKLKVVGDDTVAGLKTVHYTSDLTTEQYVDTYAADPKTRTLLKEQLTKAGTKAIKTDLWVDEQYQVRKGHIAMGTTELKYTYTDYGRPVNVVAPPANDVVDLVQMFKGLKRPKA